MSYDPLDRLKQTIKVRVPGTTDAMIDLEIVNTIDAFFHRTNAWRWSTTFNFVEGETQYDITPPENAALVRVMSMIWQDRPVLPIATASDDPTGRSGRGRITEDRHFADQNASIYQPDRVVTQGAGDDQKLRYAIFFPQYIEMSLAPDDSYIEHPVFAQLALTINVATCCEDCSLIDLPDWMYQHFHEAWLHGVQSSLMSQISKPYTNPVMSEYHGRKFRQAMAFAKQEADRGLTYDVQRWRFPRGGFITS